MLQNSFAAFEAQVQPVEFRVVFLELIDHSQRLQIVLESRRNRSCIRSMRPARHDRTAYDPDRGARQIASDNSSLRRRARAMVRANLRHLERMRQAVFLYKSPS